MNNPIKINFGCGDYPLKGWINHDLQIDGLDVTKPLPYESLTVSYVVAEHLIEHLTSPQVVFFLKEIHRILKPGGIARISVPAIEKIAALDPSYEMFLKEETHRTISNRSESIQICLCHWGHMTAWTAELLAIVLKTIFSKIVPCEYGKSENLELQGIDVHATEHYLNKMYPGITEILKYESAIMEVEK